MPLTRLTLEERIRLVRLFSLYEKASMIQKVWIKEYGTDPPSRKTIAALNKKFDETGSVADLTRSGRPKTSRSEEKVALVQNALRNDPTKSIRCLSNELGLNKAAVHRIKQESDKQKYLKLENKRLKEKISEMQKKLDIFEGKKTPGKKGYIKEIVQQDPKPSESDHSMLLFTSAKKEGNAIDGECTLPYLVSGEDLSEFHSKIQFNEPGELSNSDDHNSPTVIAVFTNHEDGHQTLELRDPQSGSGDVSTQKVRHMTIDADGQLQEVLCQEETDGILRNLDVVDGDHVILGDEMLQVEEGDVEMLSSANMIDESELIHTGVILENDIKNS